MYFTTEGMNEMSVSNLKQERDLIFDQLYTYKIPKRLISQVAFDQIFVMEYGGIDKVQGQYDFSLLKKPAEELCDYFYSDTCPIKGGGPSSRFASGIQLTGSTSFQDV